ncbi:MAG TPA: glycosyltransferase [Gemmatimonadaceae bacterium]|nr:glycosyltransferase [Gemmatimonadaceae bacterium]
MADQSPPSGERYDITPDLADENTSHAKIITLVGHGKRVLELGPASGYMTKAFKDHDCRVVAVEIDVELAQKAGAFADRMIVGDLDELDLTAELRGEAFDVVVCADVLEHLHDPGRTLKQVRALLAPDGFVAASIPSITHVSVALELLRGNFDYRPLGLLDETHRRFFSKRGIVHLFERAGFRLDSIDRTSAAPHKMEIAQSLTEFGPELVRYVEENDEAVTYQYIVTAVPFSDESELARLRSEAEELRAKLAQLEPAVLTAEHESIGAQLRSLDVRAGQLQAANLQLTSELESAAARAGQAERDHAEALAEAGSLRAGLDQVKRERSRQLREIRGLRASVARLEREREVALRSVEDAFRGMRDEVAAALVQLNAPRGWRSLRSAARDWLEAIVGRRYRPVLTPVHHLRPLAGQPGGWESTGNDPQLRIEPPLPRRWVEVRLRGRADPAATVTLYLNQGSGVRESEGIRLGVLTPTVRDIRLLVQLGRPQQARLDPGLGPGLITIDEFVFRRVGWWRVGLRAFGIALRRQRERHANPLRLVRRAVIIFRTSGWAGLRHAARAQLRYQQGPVSNEYATWLENHRMSEADMDQMRQRATQLSYRPTISFIVPVFNPQESWLRHCVDSVRAQLYDRWQLCLVDDASTDRRVRELLEGYDAADSRIDVVYRERNGHISAASNDGLAIATGDFVALLDQDDELTPDALYHIGEVLNQRPDVDILYSDEDKIDESGQRFDPYFKPDWSPELLLTNMYVSHLTAYRRSLVAELGGFRQGYEGSQDYDLLLRASERTDRIHHIPRILYHWRATKGSAAESADAKPYAATAAMAALRDALERRGIDGTVEQHRQYPTHYLVRYKPDRSQKVSIIIPTRDQASLLDRCLTSITRLTTYPNYDICVIDNGSRERATGELLHRWQTDDSRVKVLPYDVPFNFPRLNNAGVTATDGELLLFLNNDTEVLTPTWLDDMAGYTQRPEIAAVGAKLLYPDRTLQHAGVILVCGVAGHGHKGFPADAPGYFGRLVGASNYVAITAACLMVRRAVFLEVGGFDERLGVAFNDVDFCLRAHSHGYRNVCLGFVTLIHHESKSRGYEDTPERQARFSSEIELMRKRWAPVLDRDPYYNPNLAQDREDFSIAVG